MDRQSTGEACLPRGGGCLGTERNKPTQGGHLRPVSRGPSGVFQSPCPDTRLQESHFWAQGTPPLMGRGLPGCPTIDFRSLPDPPQLLCGRVAGENNKKRIPTRDLGTWENGQITSVQKVSHSWGQGSGVALLFAEVPRVVFSGSAALTI